MGDCHQPHIHSHPDYPCVCSQHILEDRAGEGEPGEEIWVKGTQMQPFLLWPCLDQAVTLQTNHSICGLTGTISRSENQ